MGCSSGRSFGAPDAWESVAVPEGCLADGEWPLHPKNAPAVGTAWPLSPKNAPAVTTVGPLEP
eukprot:244323-Chlamydomonas_euryale.AAC.1